MTPAGPPRPPIVGSMDTQRTDLDIFGRPPVHHADWSHRRGEPRVFALLWMIYLMVVTALMFASVTGALNVSQSITRPAARSMLVATMFGIAIVWPLVRFSQNVPAQGTVASVLRDWVVIIVPVQAVVIPQMFPVLAGWSLGVVLAVDAFICVWALAIGGVIAMAYRSIGESDRGVARVFWMLLVMFVVLASPVVGMLSGAGAQAGVADARVGWLMSPLTGIVELTRERSVLGQSAHIQPGHWRMIGAIGCIGAALALFGHAIEVARRSNRA